MRWVAAGLLAAAAGSVAALWPAESGDDVVIYSAMGPAGLMIPAFEAQTKLRVTYINMAGGPLQARIYAEGGRPRWTVAWFVGDAAMAALDGAGLLARHGAGEDWPDPEWTAEARGVLPDDGAYLPTGLILAGVFLSRDGTRPSADWAALAGVAGGVDLVSPVSSGTAYPVMSAMMAAVGGVKAGHALLRALRSEDLSVVESNPLLLAQLRRGATSVGVLPSQTAYSVARREPGWSVVVPRPAGLVPAVIAVSAGASPAAQAAALRFIRFLLTARGQELIKQSTAEGLAWPPVVGVPVPQGLTALDTVEHIHPDPGFGVRGKGRRLLGSGARSHPDRRTPGFADPGPVRLGCHLSGAPLPAAAGVPGLGARGGGATRGEPRFGLGDRGHA